MAALGKDLSKKSPFLLQNIWSFSTGPYGALIAYGGSFSVWPHLIFPLACGRAPGPIIGNANAI
jgi:hypothetical protein